MNTGRDYISAVGLFDIVMIGIVGITAIKMLTIAQGEGTAGDEGIIA